MRELWLETESQIPQWREERSKIEWKESVWRRAAYREHPNGRELPEPYVANFHSVAVLLWLVGLMSLFSGSDTWMAS